MKKWYFFFFLFSYSVYSQVYTKVNYVEFINFDYPLKRNETLFIDQIGKKNIYVLDIGNQKRIGDLSDKLKEDISTSMVQATISRSESLEFIEINFKTKELNLYEDFVKIFYKIEDAFPIFNWKLTNETKEINNVLCNKATTTYRGKSWEAWYAPTIPLPYGPWKLYGLPGLILEAKDDTNKYHYLASTIEYNVSENIAIPLKKVHKSITMKEYLTIQDNFHNTPKNFGRDIQDTSPKFNFLSRELEFEFPIEFKWKE